VNRRRQTEPQRRTYIGSFCQSFVSLCLTPANVPRTIVSIVIDAHALMLAVMVLMVNGQWHPSCAFPSFMQHIRELHSGRGMLRLPSASTKKCERVAKGAELRATLGGCIVRTAPAKISAVPVAHKASS